MPKELENKLKAEVAKKGIKDKNAYVYGTLRKTGWTPAKHNEFRETYLIALGQGMKREDALKYAIERDCPDIMAFLKEVEG